MICYSIKPKDQIIVKKMSKNISKNISKNLSSKHIQKFLHHAKQSPTDAL